MAARRRSTPEGVTQRHARRCGHARGELCSCVPTYQAFVPTGQRGGKRFKTFATAAAAKTWRAQQIGSGEHARKQLAPGAITLRLAADEFVAGIQDGSITNRSGDTYKPSVMRAYEQSLRLHIVPSLGALKLVEITTADLQRLSERLRREARSASNVRNAFLPLRAIYRRAESLSQVTHNPTHGLRLAAVRGRRDRVAPPEEAAALIAAVPDADRGVWATAFYSGLRIGEIRALRITDVDLVRGIIHVRASWDPIEGAVAPKSVAGERRVPIPEALLTELTLQLERVTWGSGLLVGRTPQTPFNYSSLTTRARRAWAEAHLASITPHEARHTYASLMIAAGVPAKELAEYLGHASVAITLDRYGHLFEGTHRDAARRLDAYLMSR